MAATHKAAAGYRLPDLSPAFQTHFLSCVGGITVAGCQQVVSGCHSECTELAHRLHLHRPQKPCLWLLGWDSTRQQPQAEALIPAPPWDLAHRRCTANGLQREFHPQRPSAPRERTLTASRETPAPGSPKHQDCVQPAAPLVHKQWTRAA